MDPIKGYHDLCVLRTLSGSLKFPLLTTITTEGSHLCRASGQGELGLVKSLVEVLDVPVDARDRCGRTPLHCASMYGHKDVVLYLLGKKCIVDTAEFLHGLTALHLAAWNNQLDAATKCLVQHGATINARAPAVNELLADLTPLHVASEQGHTNMCQFLISHGAKVNAITPNGISPLHLASRRNHLGVVKILVQHVDDINSGTAETNSVFLQACVEGSNDVVRFLLDHGADVNQPTKSKLTPLTLFACAGQLETAQLLVERGALVNARPNDDGTSALSVASLQGHAAVAEMLLANGADINLANAHGFTALHNACCSENRSSTPSVVRILLDKGDLINRKSSKGRTALHLACQNGDLETVKLLSERGATLNAQCIQGNTPLHFACHFGHLNVTEELLKRGANTDLRNSLGYTPMDVIASKFPQLVL